MKAMGLVVLDIKCFENCILKTSFLTQWPTYPTIWNCLNNFNRGPHRDPSCEVWSKSNKWFQMRCSLKKLLTHARTDAQMVDDGQWAIAKAHLEHVVLRWAKKIWSLEFHSSRFFKTAFWKPFFDPVITYATNQNHLNNFGRGPPRDHFCWVW